MRMGVLGTGMVGHAIASKLVAIGHEVMMGSREAGALGTTVFNVRIVPADRG